MQKESFGTNFEVTSSSCSSTVAAHYLFWNQSLRFRKIASWT